MYTRSNIQPGMTVRDRDGHKLGHVILVDDEAFFVEKGLFFPRDYLCRFADVAEVRGDDVVLAHGRDDLLRHDVTTTASAGTEDLTGAGVTSADTNVDELRSLDASVPVASSVAAARRTEGASATAGAGPVAGAAVSSAERRVPLGADAGEVRYAADREDPKRPF